MPTAPQILEGLSRVANTWWPLAVLWHAVLGAAIFAIGVGWRPDRRVALAATAAPVAGVAALAAWSANPFSAILLGLGAAGLMAAAATSARGTIHASIPVLRAIGAAGIAFGWIYPHFLETDHAALRLVAAPLGLVPCPTLAAVASLWLFVDGSSSRAFGAVAGALALFYGLFGIMRLGVLLDVPLVAIGLVAARAVGSRAWPTGLRRSVSRWPSAPAASGMDRAGTGCAIARRKPVRAAGTGAADRAGMTRPFTASDAIAFGWEETKKRFTEIFLPLGALTAILSIAEGNAQREGQGALHLLLQLIGAFVTLGWWRIALRLHDGRPASIRSLSETTISTYLQYVVAIFFFWVLVVVGLLALVLPGVVLAARLSLAPMIVADQEVDAVTALRRSWELTEGRTVEMCVFGILLGGLNLLGALALGIGLFATVPTSYLAAVYVERRLAALRPARPDGAAPAPAPA